MRTFLFLEGPHGPFFKKLQNKLMSFGYRCHSIALNGGYCIDGKLNTHIYSGSLENWSFYLTCFLKKHNITDILLYGDKRSYHSIAINVAKNLNIYNNKVSSISTCPSSSIRIWCFEEGYVRPGYVTLEENGNNTNSLVPFYFNEYVNSIPNFDSDGSCNNINNIIETCNNNDNLNIKNHINEDENSYSDILPNPMSRKVKLAINHYLGIFFLYPLFLKYSWHRKQGFSNEIIGWLIRKLRDFKYNDVDAQIINNIIKTNRKYFLLPLQLKEDFQITCASTFRDIVNVIETVVPSFLKHSYTDDLLVIKLHPLDNSIFNYRTFIEKLSKSLDYCNLNATNKIIFIAHYNNNKQLLANSQGVVVVNSTMGISAIELNIPTITLGNSIYSNKGLAVNAFNCGYLNIEKLNKFWKNPKTPNANYTKAFIHILYNKSLVLGNFYTDEGIEQTIKGVLDRLDIKGIKHCKILSPGIKKLKNIDSFLKDIDFDCVIGWGHKKSSVKARLYAKKNNLPYVALEDGFIRSISIEHKSKDEDILSLVIDKTGIYYDASSPSDLENYILDYPNWLNNEVFHRTIKLINDIVENNIVKYNIIPSDTAIESSNISIMPTNHKEQKLTQKLHDIKKLFNDIKTTKEFIINNSNNSFSKYKKQPLDSSALIKQDHTFNTSDSNINKVLLIDQTYGDCSVIEGNANENDFKLMLHDAINKYGESNVYVKIHPDVISKKARGYFKLKELQKKNINIISDNINTMELLKKFKNVYVVTSGTGFEALMCGCNVTCYGEPFYSNWGVTNDKKTSSRVRRLEKIISKDSTKLTFKCNLKTTIIIAIVGALFYKYSIYNYKIKQLL